MRSIPAAKLVLLGLGAAACGGGSTGPNPPAGLKGNFAITNSSGFWLGLTLHETAGVVSGTGWSGDLMRLKLGITVTGTYHPPAVELDLLQRRDGVIRHFSGTFERDTLRGVYQIDQASQPLLELTRVDTVPTGDYLLHLSGGVTGDFPGEGSFVHYTSLGTRGVGLSLDAAGILYRFGISWDNTDRPAAGVYQLTSAPGARPTLAVFGREAGILGFQQFPFLSGTFTLDVSSRWAMIGRFDFTGTDPASGAVVTAHGTFNTGCVGTTC